MPAPPPSYSTRPMYQRIGDGVKTARLQNRRVPGTTVNDEVVTPTSMFAAYNAITAPKRLLLASETGHRRTPEQEGAMNAWLEMVLSGR